MGRLGVDDSDPEAGDDGDSRFSMWGDRDGEACCVASSQRDEVRDIVVVGEQHVGSLVYDRVCCIGNVPGDWPDDPN